MKNWKVYTTTKFCDRRFREKSRLFRIPLCVTTCADKKSDVGRKGHVSEPDLNRSTHYMHWVEHCWILLFHARREILAKKVQWKPNTTDCREIHKGCGSRRPCATQCWGGNGTKEPLHSVSDWDRTGAFKEEIGIEYHHHVRFIRQLLRV
jgi:hypothetical protein